VEIWKKIDILALLELCVDLVDDKMSRLEITEIVSCLQILSEGSKGRYALSSLLDTTRARTRLLLTYLSDMGLASPSKGRGGTSLTKLGRELVERIDPVIHLDYDHRFCEVEDDVFPRSEHFFTVFLKSNNIETNGIFERDLAVRKGADGAITLIRKENGWGYPNSEESELQGILINQKDPWNVAIICFSDIPGKALRGAVESGLYHTETEVREIVGSSIFTPLTD
jgi:hypothetical protein